MVDEKPYLAVTASIAAPHELAQELVLLLGELGFTTPEQRARVASVIAQAIVANLTELRTFESGMHSSLVKLLDELCDVQFGRYSPHVQARRAQLAKVVRP